MLNHVPVSPEWYQIPYIFHRPETDQDENVFLERWRWIAVFEDGSRLEQFEGHPLEERRVFHQFAEIDQAHLVFFAMASYEYPNHEYRLVFDPTTMKLIHFYTHQHLNVGSLEEIKQKFYNFGYEKTLEGKTHKTLLVITPQDHLVVTDDPNIQYS